jgi:hypothetical protein
MYSLVRSKTSFGIPSTPILNFAGGREAEYRYDDGDAVKKRVFLGECEEAFQETRDMGMNGWLRMEAWGMDGR